MDLIVTQYYSLKLFKYTLYKNIFKLNNNIIIFFITYVVFSVHVHENIFVRHKQCLSYMFNYIMTALKYFKCT